MNSSNAPVSNEHKTAELLGRNLREHHGLTDRTLAVLLGIEWMVGIAVALVYSPATWTGSDSAIHSHVYWAIFFGGGLTLFPCALAWLRPGHPTTRHAVTIGQMLMCALFIHLSGGRISTHFYIFGSLAFIAFYRDWKVLLTATLVTALDHLFRGVWYPMSIFGTTTSSISLVIEHAAYVIFEDIVLVIGIFYSLREMQLVARKQVEAEAFGTELRAEKETAEKAAGELESQHRYLAENTAKMLVEMDKFAAGDLRVKLEKSRDDEMGKLIDGFNRAVAQTGALIEQVLRAVGSTVETVDQISAASASLVDNARVQRSEAGDATGIIQGLVEESRQNVETVRETANVAVSGGEVAARGREIVNKSVQKMEQIAEVVTESTSAIEKLGASSDEIGRIVSTINDISRQTNLLALNAAVEAARAGEKGAGFAVVAGEVRALSLRTSEAVAQINDVIQSIQAEITHAIGAMRTGTRVVEEGIGLSTATREALDNIVASSDDIAVRIGRVAGVNTKQAETNEVVIEKAETISRIASETAENVETIVGTVDLLSGLASELRSTTSRFALSVAGEERKSRRVEVQSGGTRVH